MENVQHFEIPDIQQTVSRREEVEQMTGFGRTKIYALINPNSKYYDPTFPTPVRLRGGGNISGRTVVWVRQEIANWVKNQIDLDRGII